MRTMFRKRPGDTDALLTSGEFIASSSGGNRIDSSQPWSSSDYSWVAEPEEPVSKKGMGGLVRKLSCTASRRERDLQLEAEEMMHLYPPVSKPDPEITRSVLITVKDGEEQPTVPDKDNSFVVGPSPDRSKSSGRFSFGKSARKPSTPLGNGFLSRVSFGRGNSPQRKSRDTNDVLTAQERARKSRWMRGFEQSWKDDGGVPSLISGDESTFECSVQTGSYSLDSYSTEASSESGYIPKKKKSFASNLPCHASSPWNCVRTSPPRGRNNPAAEPEIQKERSMWDDVADDMKIIAGLLISDGNACMGSVATITHETMVDSCKPQR